MADTGARAPADAPAAGEATIAEGRPGEESEHRRDLDERRQHPAGRQVDEKLRGLIVMGMLVVIGAIAALGGFADADDGVALDGFVEGETLQAPPFELTIERIRHVDELDGLSLQDDRNRWIAAVATVRNTSDVTVHEYLLSDSVRLVGVDGLVEPRFSLVASNGGNTDNDENVASAENGDSPKLIRTILDGNDLGVLQPGLRYELAMFWEHDGRLEPPGEVEVLVLEHRWRASVVDSQEQWRDPTERFRATVNLAPGRGS